MHPERHSQMRIPVNELVSYKRPVFKTLTDYHSLPIWVHTFNTITSNGIKIFMGLCQKYPAVPVIFGHMGAQTGWM